MPQTLIDGVQVKQQRLNADGQGVLMEAVRPDRDVFRQSGRVCATSARPGVEKAWHYHEKQRDHFTCVRGMWKAALSDSGETAPTRRVIK